MAENNLQLSPIADLRLFEQAAPAAEPNAQNQEQDLEPLTREKAETYIDENLTSLTRALRYPGLFNNPLAWFAQDVHCANYWTQKLGFVDPVHYLAWKKVRGPEATVEDGAGWSLDPVDAERCARIAFGHESYLGGNKAENMLIGYLRTGWLGEREYATLQTILKDLANCLHVQEQEQDLSLRADFTSLVHQGNLAARALGFVDLAHYYWACRRVGMGRDWRNQEWALRPLDRERAARIAFYQEEKSDETAGESLLLEWLGENWCRERAGVAPAAGEEVIPSTEDRPPAQQPPNHEQEEYHCHLCDRPDSSDDLVECDVEGCETWDHRACCLPGYPQNADLTDVVYCCDRHQWKGRYQPKKKNGKRYMYVDVLRKRLQDAKTEVKETRPRIEESADLYSSTSRRDGPNCHLCDKDNSSGIPIASCKAAEGCQIWWHAPCLTAIGVVGGYKYYCDEHQPEGQVSGKNKGKKRAMPPSSRKRLQSEDGDSANAEPSRKRSKTSQPQLLAPGMTEPPPGPEMYRTKSGRVMKPKKR